MKRTDSGTINKSPYILEEKFNMTNNLQVPIKINSAIKQKPRSSTMKLGESRPFVSPIIERDNSLSRDSVSISREVTFEEIEEKDDLSLCNFQINKMKQKYIIND